ncbi:MAG: nucleotidyl transferase AbiEii/AbiGii toxin family protein [Bacteroidales bacterium]|nr:nucleotidyl transferase AbiEii/AbiGii toxin family protein [Bacteroidales bacterium]
MIPRAYITEWQKNAPWKNNAQVEQDLVIERALVDLFANDLIRENLAFRGGTALHKMFFKPQIRYSEDIDLVQIKATEIGDLLSTIRKILSYIDKKPRYKSNNKNNTFVFRFESEIEPIHPLRLKVEINCREHFTILGWKEIKHVINNSWFSGESNIISYELEELLGTKMRALYQRSKGRDLFDLYYALNNADLNISKIIQCYKRYMEFSDKKPATSKEIIANLEDKMNDENFKGDIVGLLRPEVKFDMHKAYELVKKELLNRI